MPISKYLRSSTNPEPVRVIVQQLRVSVRPPKQRLTFGLQTVLSTIGLS
jgi:hypothetical protein